MLSFASAVLLLMITPGPGVLSLSGVGAAFGFRAGLRYMFGLFLGTNVVALAVVTGLAALVLANPAIRTVLLVASTAYLLYLALRIALAGSKIAIVPAARQPGLRAGLALQAINPKAYVVNTTLFSGFPFAQTSYASEIALKFLIVNIIWISIHFLWLWLGGAIRQLDLSPPIQRAVNIAMAASMLGVVALAALS